MINKSSKILLKKLVKVEGILREFLENVVLTEQEQELTVNTMEQLMGGMISRFTNIGLELAGELLSNIEMDNTDRRCSCGKKMVVTKRNALVRILSKFGYMQVERDELFCRRCHKGQGVIDKAIEMYEHHRITKGMTEMLTYVGQLIPSFDKGEELLKKMLNIDVSGTQIQIVSEEIGKEVFEKDAKEAKRAYERPWEAAPEEVPAKKKEGRLYILADGLQVNTRTQDNNGSTWREMKLGLVFYDKDTITRESGSVMITKKEYVSYFGSVEEFKKMLFATAARAGYGKIKEVVVIGDGAQWIWNMCKEVFPDAVQILDFYHMSENVNDYAKVIHPEDEVKRKQFVNSVLTGLLEGKIVKALTIVRANKIEKLPETSANLLTYILNNRIRINYKEHVKLGRYVGSGAIESANKMVIQQRMKQSGMRWGISGGQYIAALRSKYESKHWDKVVDIINAA